MSLAKLKLVFLPQAREDFVGIMQYTEMHWGRPQRDVYAQLLNRHLLLLREFPESGQLQPALGESIRLKRAGRHLVVYIISADTIFILRIVHESMSINRQVI